MTLNLLLKKFYLYMNKFFGFLFLLLLASAHKSQLIDNSLSNVFSDDPFFNSEIVKLNKLKSLHGDISTKKELSPIKSSGKNLHFEFDRQGNLKQQ